MNPSDINPQNTGIDGLSGPKTADEMERELKAEKNPLVRAALIKELGNIKDAKYADSIGEELDHPEIPVRIASVEALFKIRSKDSIPWLIVASSDRSDKVRNIAFSSLKRFSRAEISIVISELAQAQDKKTEQAIEILARLGDPISKNTLHTMLKNPLLLAYHEQIIALLGLSEGFSFTIKYKLKKLRADKKAIIIGAFILIITIISPFILFSTSDPLHHEEKKSKKTAGSFSQQSSIFSSLTSQKEKKHSLALRKLDSFSSGRKDTIRFGREVPNNIRQLILAEDNKKLKEAEELIKKGYLDRAEKMLGDLMAEEGLLNPYLAAFIYIELGEIYKMQDRHEDCKTIVGEYLKTYNKIMGQGFSDSIEGEKDEKILAEAVERLNKLMVPDAGGNKNASPAKKKN